METRSAPEIMNGNSVHFYEENTKELYNLNDDFSESNNLADVYPEKILYFNSFNKWMIFF